MATPKYEVREPEGPAKGGILISPSRSERPEPRAPTLKTHWTRRCVAPTLMVLALGSCARRVEDPPHRKGVPDFDETVRIDEELSVRKVAAGAFVVTQNPGFESNVLVVLMQEGETAVLCSSPLDTAATRVLLRWVREAFAPERILDINTHYHPDGTAGNEAYEEAGVETYSTPRTRELLAANGERVREECAAALADRALAASVTATRVLPAAHTFDAAEGLTLTFGEEVVRVIYPGPAHSPDNVVVHFPSQELLFGGCMIKAGKSIGNVLDADLEHWEAAVHVLEPLNARVVVPGHGPVGGPELLQNTIDVVRAARP
jgi:glyoxylase-like metal-dependent hydrolase (beta-lactamase superfamily II)